MRTEDILRVYQSYSLAKISALSKQNLIAQYAQCEKLEQLKQELAYSVETNKQILQNQIKELERQEKLRYYKNLVFKVNQALSLVENQTSINFKSFLVSLFIKPISLLATESVQNLEDITDKEYANNIVRRAKDLSNQCETNKDNYQSSCWNAYTQLQGQIKTNSANELNGKLETLKAQSEKYQNGTTSKKGCSNFLLILAILNLCVVAIGSVGIVKDDASQLSVSIFMTLFAALLLLLTILSRRKNKHKNISKSEELRRQIEHLQIELDSELKKSQQDSQEMAVLKTSLSTDCSQWESVISSIGELLPYGTIDSQQDYDSSMPEVVEDGSFLDKIERKLDKRIAYYDKKLADLDGQKKK